jgi:D-alanyl-D-alanine endopeptidase (penicillin-binding protein 7)
MKYFICLLIVLYNIAYAKRPEPSIWLYNISDNTSIVKENSEVQRPLASITKLMTAMVVLDQSVNLDEKITKKLIGPLPIGTYTRRELLTAMLVKSDNSAAETLSQNYPGGRKAFINAMNKRADSLGMIQTSFDDASGLSKKNISSARDISKMLVASLNYNFIKETSRMKQAMFETYYKKKIRTIKLDHTSKQFLFEFDNIVITKTGYTNPAGFCLALVVEQQNKFYTVVVMGTPNSFFRFQLVKKLLNNEIPYNDLLDSDLR